jgi:hypothetical protein
MWLINMKYRKHSFNIQVRPLKRGYSISFVDSDKSWQKGQIWSAAPDNSWWVVCQGHFVRVRATRTSGGSYMRRIPLV